MVMWNHNNEYTGIQIGFGYQFTMGFKLYEWVNTGRLHNPTNMAMESTQSTVHYKIGS